MFLISMLGLDTLLRNHQNSVFTSQSLFVSVLFDFVTLCLSWCYIFHLVAPVLVFWDLLVMKLYLPDLFGAIS